MEGAMHRLMAPRSVAVVGASERPGASGGFVVTNFLRAGFTGRIVPVHPSAATVFGLAAVPRLGALAEPVDAVVVAVAAERAVEVIEEAAAVGIKAAVVLASGFAELGEAGRERQAALQAIGRAAAMAICGPNCLGLVNLSSGAALYSTRLSPSTRRGGVAVISHSGAAAVALAGHGRFGVSHIVSAGNAAVSDVPDFLQYLAGDPNVRVAALFLEAVRDPAAFADAVAAMRAAGKPVVALKVGRSAKAAATSAAHTGSLAGSGEAFDAYFRRIGVVAVDDFDELIETSALFEARMPPAHGRGVGIAAVSGGGAAHVCDIAEAVGVAIPDIAPETKAKLKALLPSYATPANPLDVTSAAFGDAAVYAGALAALEADPAIGLVAAVQDVPAGLDAGGAEEYAGIAGAVAAHARRATKPVVLVSNLSSGIHPDLLPQLSEAGVPVLNGTRAGLAAIRHFTTWTEPVRGMGRDAVPMERQANWVKRLGEGPLSEREAKTFLADHGLRVTRESLARTADDAAKAAAAIGFPVALKIESPDIAHKTEAGGVRLGLADGAAVARAFAEIVESVAARAPTARVEGVLVQEMVTGGVEVLIGMARHAPFGPAVVFGAGGVMVELLRDTALGLLPLDLADAAELIGATRVAKLLDGYRGAPPADRAALGAAIVTLGRIAAAYEPEIEAIDLNPVSVLPEARGAIVLDALIVPRHKNG